MNETETNPSADLSANQKIESLRSQMNLLFGALLVASFTLTAFLGLQARRASLDVLTLKGPAEESMHLVQQDNAGVEAALGKLVEFGRTHPDFQRAVLSKYQTNTNSASAAATKKK